MRLLRHAGCTDADRSLAADADGALRAARAHLRPHWFVIPYHTFSHLLISDPIGLSLPTCVYALLLFAIGCALPVPVATPTDLCALGIRVSLAFDAGLPGSPLPEEGVPLLIRQCCAVLNRDDGLETVGLFRLAGAPCSCVRMLYSNAEEAFTQG